MQLTKVTATTRTESGKGPARRARAAGQIPAVSYSKGQPAQHLSVSPLEVVAALKSERGRNAVVEIEIDGKTKQTAMIREYQYHPVSRELLHADFIQVDEKEPVEVNIPLRLTGKPKGVVMGGTLRQVFREIPVRCVPGAIPVIVEHDITDLDNEDHLQAQDLKLPEGVEILLPPKRTIASVSVDRKAKAEEEAAAAAAATPAAGKK